MHNAWYHLIQHILHNTLSVFISQSRDINSYNIHHTNIQYSCLSYHSVYPLSFGFSFSSFISNCFYIHHINLFLFIIPICFYPLYFAFYFYSLFPTFPFHHTFHTNIHSDFFSQSCVFYHTWLYLSVIKLCHWYLPVSLTFRAK